MVEHMIGHNGIKTVIDEGQGLRIMHHEPQGVAVWAELVVRSGQHACGEIG
jgi:hypothetical protein